MGYRQEGSCIIGCADPPYTGLFNGKTQDEQWEITFKHWEGCTCNPCQRRRDNQGENS
jgi:hypothetical protein